MYSKFFSKKTILKPFTEESGKVISYSVVINLTTTKDIFRSLTFNLLEKYDVVEIVYKIVDRKSHQIDNRQKNSNKKHFRRSRYSNFQVL